MAISTLFSPPLSLKYPHLPPKITTHATLSLPNPLRFQSGLRLSRVENLNGAFGNWRRRLGFRVRGENGGGGERRTEEEKEMEELRGKSTMPDRFRPLTKEAPDPPLRWPWFVALAFLIYAWRSVLWELSNWRKALISIIHFIIYISKLLLAFIFHFIGDPISYTIFYIETALYALRSFYSSIVSSAPVPDLTLIIILASTVLSISEAAVPNSVNTQPHLLTISGIIAYGAVKGFVSEALFWMVLFGVFIFARFVKKRDVLSSTLPGAVALASVGEPWVRFLAIASFTALAIYRYYKNPVEGEGDGEASDARRRVPIPLLGVGLAIGIRVAAKWAGYRHLTWMIV